MRRRSLILAMSMFAGVAGGVLAQTQPEGRAPDAERRAIDRTEEDQARAGREGSEPSMTMEWLSEPPGVDSRVAGVSAASSTPHQAQCAVAQVAAIKQCHDEWQRCFGTSFSPSRFLRCSNEAIVCIEAAYKAYEACMEEDD